MSRPAYRRRSAKSGSQSGQTEEAWATKATLRHYGLIFSPDGAVTSENVIPGDYRLNVVLKDRAGTFLGWADVPVKVSAEHRDVLDLGVLPVRAVSVPA